MWVPSRIGGCGAESCDHDCLAAPKWTFATELRKCSALVVNCTGRVDGLRVDYTRYSVYRMKTKALFSLKSEM